jgi:hypothetical protein
MEAKFFNPHVSLETVIQNIGWRMNAHMEGLKIRSYVDLIKVANVPKVMKEEEEGFDLYFWSPAFKVPPELFLKLTQGMTIS